MQVVEKREQLVHYISRLVNDFMNDSIVYTRHIANPKFPLSRTNTQTHKHIITQTGGYHK